MKLRVEHRTDYRYASAVAQTWHTAMLLPRSTPAQEVLSSSLFVTPEPEAMGHTLDAFGNWRSQFAFTHAHEALAVLASSEITTRTAPAPAFELPSWEAVQRHYRYQKSAAFDPAAEFGFASPYVPHTSPASALAKPFFDYAQQSFTSGRALAEAATCLMERIHRDFSYAPDSTSVESSPLHALAQMRGVCQDFAHVLIACLRTLGLPARYVSGYLLTEPPPGQPRLVGADASHAWASVHLPSPQPRQEGAWLDLCPTNARSGWHSPGLDYVTLAWGRDYSDVAPLRGVIAGGAAHSMQVAVTVTGL